MEIFCDKEEFKREANFYEYFLDNLIKEYPDFNLIMFWNFIGIKLTSLIGFRFTTLIFIIINPFLFLSTYNINYLEYKSEECKYSYPKIIALFFNWVFMAICFGGSSLLVQQKLIDSYSLLDYEEEKEKIKNTTNSDITLFFMEKVTEVFDNGDDEIFEKYGYDFGEENDDSDDDDDENKLEKSDTQKEVEFQKDDIKQKNFNCLLVFGLSNAFGYAGKYGIGLGIAYYKQNIYSSNNETIYNNSSGLNNITDNYPFYSNSSNISVTNQTSLIVNEYELNQTFFIAIGIIYAICIAFSTYFLYSLLVCFYFNKIKKEKNNKTDKKEESNKEKKDKENKTNEEERLEEKLNGCCLWRNTCEICGCIIYSERLLLEKDSNHKGCFQLFCETINNYCNNAICNMCNCRKNNKNLCCCCCCSCCCIYQEIHFEKNKQCFCYCYQEKGFCDYINKFIINETQREIIFCSLLYFISKLATNGSEKRYNIILKDNNIFDEVQNFYFSLLICFFVITELIIQQDCNKCRKKKSIFEDEDEELHKWIGKAKKHTNDIFVKFTKKLNKTLLGIIEIFFINIVLGFFYSYYYLIGRYQNDADELLGKMYLYFHIIINAYFTFLLNYYCLIVAKSKTIFEFLFTQTILVTIYITISDFFIKGINLISQNINFYLWIQMIITGIILIILIFNSFRYVFINKRWIRYKKGICICRCCCCDDENFCYSECCDSKCSSCNCRYLCCEPCCLKLSNALLK